MEKKAIDAIQKAFVKLFDFGSISIETTFRMIFLAGLFFVLRASCAYASGLFINVNVMRETAPNFFMGESSPGLAALGGGIHFIASGCIWRVICEWAYRLMQYLCAGKPKESK